MPLRNHCIALPLLLAAAAGCSNNPPPQTPAPTPAAQTTPAKTPSEKPAESEPAHNPRGGELLGQAKTALDAGQTNESRELLDELRKIEGLSEEEQKQLSDLDAQLAVLIDQENEAERDASLKRVPDFLATGKLDDAAAALETASARKPTDEQRDEIAKFRKEIETIRGAQRKLGTYMKLLSSQSRSDVRAAQSALLDEPAAALPLLLQAIQEPGDRQRTVNLLETLRQLRKPQATLPALVGVLERSAQKESWPDAVEALGKISADGAGPLLLKLWSGSQDAEQRAAALTALSRVPDPPAETLLALLPSLSHDRPDLAATLLCLAQAVRRHDQTDLVGLHGFPSEITAEQSQQLSQLSARLEALRSSADAETARGAKTLSVALGLLVPEPIAGIQVLDATGGYADGLGKATLDGVWNSVDVKTMWYHPLGPDSQIVLDLGSEKTVTGVVLWNLNQQGAGFRGWKHADVYVSPTPTALYPVATGVVPMAPGAADPPDYSTRIDVPCVTGRYVKLKAKDLWNANAHTGLAEIQVLGF